TIGTYFVGLSVIAGVALAFGFILFYKSVESQQISNITVLALLQPLILVTYSLLFLNESITLIQIIGGAIILVGITLDTTTREIKFNKFLIPAILGEISWAIFWIILSKVILITGNLATPLLISRAAAAVTAIFAYLLLFNRSKSKTVQKTSRGKFSIPILIIFALFAGVFDGVGNIAFGITTSLNQLVLVSIFNAFLPLLVILAAYVIYKERLTYLQKIGIAIATVGAVIITVI
ncbi:MAG: EamA family transporter, partial [Candidatus Micrarchaeales archaeon]